MADERMSDGELVRRFERLERDLAETNRQMVSANVYEAKHAAMIERLAADETNGRERHKSVMAAIGKLETQQNLQISQQQNRKDLTVGRLISILAVAATLLVGWWSVFGSRGH